MSKASLLIVDDERFYTSLLEDILHPDYNIIIARDGTETIEILNKHPIDLILLDILMPGIDGYKVCKQIKGSELFNKIPIIFLTVKNETEDEIKGFEFGAVDFIKKPISPPVVKARVATQVALSLANKKLQQYAHELEQLVTKRTEELTQKISEKQKVSDQLHYLANYDQLTRLPNRNLFNERLEQTYQLARRNSSSFSLLFIDLDDFKHVNDSFGHHIGDLLLEQVGLRLSKCLRGVDTVARLGGDEFIVTLTKIHNKQDSIVVAEKVLQELARPFEVNRHIIQIGSSIGITTYPDDDENLDSMLRNADLAMYEAKHSGKNAYKFFTSDMATTHLYHHMELEKDLQNALLYNELYLNYQTIIDLQSGNIAGVECLLRWQHPKLGQFKPEKIITIAEQSNLVIKLGKWILDSAFEQLDSWLKQGFSDLQFIAINISAHQFDRNNENIVLIKNLIKQYKLPRHSIHLEIPESLLLENTQFIANILSELKELGILLSVDDFGTGYSSLNYLRRFPINLIKIDQSIISGLGHSSGDKKTAKAIIAMGKSLNLKIIAEGVETKEQLDFLKEHDCHFAQGYYFSKPVSSCEIGKLLKDERLKKNQKEFFDT